MKRFSCLAVVLALYALPATAYGASIMPDFASVPTGWQTDRYEPASFANVGDYQGRSDVLGIGISNAQGFNNRPLGQQTVFYDTQGRRYLNSGGAGSILAADLFIPLNWSNAANGSVRTDMWAIMTDTDGVITDYPIIGFTNYLGDARLRIYDRDSSLTGWVDLTASILGGAWNSLAIAFTGSSYDYYVNETLAYSDLTINSTTGFKGVIMQAYNFYDNNMTGANPIDYTAYWSNAQPVPEPATMLLIGAGLVGLVATRRKKEA